MSSGSATLPRGVRSNVGRSRPSVVIITAVMSVSTTPGATALTRIPDGPQLTANVRSTSPTPDFAAAYAGTNGLVRTVESDEIHTTERPLGRRPSASAPWSVRSADRAPSGWRPPRRRRSPGRTHRHPPGRFIPVLLTRTSSVSNDAATLGDRVVRIEPQRQIGDAFGKSVVVVGAAAWFPSRSPRHPQRRTLGRSRRRPPVIPRSPEPSPRRTAVAVTWAPPP